METLTDLVKEALVEDLKEVYGRLDEREFKDNFYFYVLSSNPKFYPISGLQHYIGTGLLALRLVEHLKISGAIKKGMSESHEYNKLVAFLAGLFHDLNKWAIKKKEDIKDVFQTTNLYNELSRAFGESARRDHQKRFRHRRKLGKRWGFETATENSRCRKSSGHHDWSRGVLEP
jgi:hypothetical protein